MRQQGSPHSAAGTMEGAAIGRNLGVVPPVTWVAREAEITLEVEEARHSNSSRGKEHQKSRNSNYSSNVMIAIRQ